MHAEWKIGNFGNLMMDLMTVIGIYTLQTWIHKYTNNVGVLAFVVPYTLICLLPVVISTLS